MVVIIFFFDLHTFYKRIFVRRFSIENASFHFYLVYLEHPATMDFPDKCCIKCYFIFLGHVTNVSFFFSSNIYRMVFGRV